MIPGVSESLYGTVLLHSCPNLHKTSAITLITFILMIEKLRFMLAQIKKV